MHMICPWSVLFRKHSVYVTFMYRGYICNENTLFMCMCVCLCIRNKSIRVPYKKKEEKNIFIAISVCNLYMEATKRTLENE